MALKKPSICLVLWPYALARELRDADRSELAAQAIDPSLCQSDPPAIMRRGSRLLRRCHIACTCVACPPADSRPFAAPPPPRSPSAVTIGDTAKRCAGRSRPPARAADIACGSKRLSPARRVSIALCRNFDHCISRPAASPRQRSCSESRPMHALSALLRTPLRPRNLRGTAVRAGLQAAERSEGRQSEQLRPRRPRLTAAQVTHGSVQLRRRMRQRRVRTCPGRHADAMVCHSVQHQQHMPSGEPDGHELVCSAKLL